MSSNAKTLQILLGFFLLIVLGSIGYYVITYIIELFKSLDRQVAAAILTASGTILAATMAALFVQKRTKEREIAAAHRAQKAEIYSSFMKTLVDALRTSIEKKEINPEEYTNFFIDFTRDVIVWGSPEFLKAFHKWRTSDLTNENALLLVDDLLMEIRRDLGNSNKGIQRGELMRLFIKQDDHPKLTSPTGTNLQK